MSKLHDIFYPVICGRGSVLLWRQCNRLYSSGFVDDVIFACNRPVKGDTNRVYYILKVTHQEHYQGESLMPTISL